ncbi:MAG: PepSY domain-containing protein [Campylobacterales bacterium]|nr:PepSY domain-containing protein [Campylobacterales bacterium]
MKKHILIVVVLSVAAFAKIDSSVDIPYDKHLKYTLGNQKKHPTITLEGKKYFENLAKLSKEEAKQIVEKEKMDVTAVTLLDLHQELVYEVYSKDQSGKKYKIYLDAGNGNLLEKQEK